MPEDAAATGTGQALRLADVHGGVRDALRRIDFEREYGALESGQTVDLVVSKWQGSARAADASPSVSRHDRRLGSLRPDQSQPGHARFERRRRQPEPVGRATGAADAPAAAFDDAENVLLLDLHQPVAAMA